MMIEQIDEESKLSNSEPDRSDDLYAYVYIML